MLKLNVNFKVELNEESILVNLYDTLEAACNSRIKNIIISVNPYPQPTPKSYSYEKQPSLESLLAFLFLKMKSRQGSCYHYSDQSDHYSIFISLTHT